VLAWLTRWAKALLRLVFTRQYLAFLLCGGSGSVVNWATRFVYNRYVSFNAAVVLAYATGMVVSYVLYRLFVFKQSARPLGSRIAAYIAVDGWGCVQTLLIANGLRLYLFKDLIPQGAADALGHLGGIASLAVTSFFLHKFVTFAEPAPAAP
jgi:putative flippase GtrA